jgi:hypothetical protein
VTLSAPQSALIRDREAARQRKDWALADRLRKELTAPGVEVRDGPRGTEWEIVTPRSETWLPRHDSASARRTARLAN